MVSHIDDETPDPVLDERVRSLLDALAAPTEAGPLPGELDAVAAFRARQRTRRISMSHVTPFRVAVASAVGAGLFLTGGVAAASTGTLPGAAQQTAHDVLAAVGLEVPSSEQRDDHADHADVRGPGEGTAPEEVEVDVTPVAAVEDVTPAEERANEAAEFGLMISEIARDPELEGVEKGKAVSSAATGGKGADPQGPPTELPGNRGADAPAGPETGESRSAEGRANAPSGGAGAPERSETEDEVETEAPRDTGAEKGDTASGGRSSAGAGNSGRP